LRRRRPSPRLGCGAKEKRKKERKKLSQLALVYSGYFTGVSRISSNAHFLKYDLHSLLGPNILLSNLFSHTLAVFSSLSVRDEGSQVSATRECTQQVIECTRQVKTVNNGTL
jgi:hypothetical protein